MPPLNLLLLCRQSSFPIAYSHTTIRAFTTQLIHKMTISDETNPSKSVIPSFKSSETDWFLVTGQPGCGKTTAVLALVEHLRTSMKVQVRFKGFVTEEVLNKDGSREGFDVVTIPCGKRGQLSRKNGLPSAFPKTGKYSVDVESFNKLALPSLSDDDDSMTVYVLDEIGRMELHSDPFKERVRALLQRGVRLVGAITAPIYGHRVPFCDQLVASSPNIRVRKLTSKNRDAEVAELKNMLVTRWMWGKDENTLSSENSGIADGDCGTKRVHKRAKKTL